MTSLASVIGSNIREIGDQIDIVKSSKISKLQAEVNYAKSEIIRLQMELKNLKSAETLMLQKMNVAKKLEDLDKYYHYDRYQNNDSLPMVKPSNNAGLPYPDPRLNIAQTKISRGFESLQAERDRIGSDILKTSQQIQIQKQRLSDAQQELKDLGSNIQVYQSKDFIVKRNYSEVYMLYEVHIKYRNLSTNNAGNRGFSTDSQILVQLQNLAQKFQAYSERNSYVLSGELKLDFDDPGSDFNAKTLSAFLERLRKLMGEEDVRILDNRLKNITNELTTNLNDPFISKQIIRQNESIRVPPENQKFSNNTETPASTVSFVNKSVDWINNATKIWMGFDQTSIGVAATEWFSRHITGLYGGLPPCDPVPQDPTQQQKDAENKAQAQAEQQAAQIMTTQFSKTKSTITQEEITNQVATYLNLVNSAVDNKSDTGINGQYSLTVGTVIYIAKNLYQVRILKNAYIYMNYLNDQLAQGNLNFSQTLNDQVYALYDYFVLRLINVLNKINPALDREELGF